MNLLILRPEQVVDNHSAVVTDRQLQHMREVQKLIPGDSLRCGMLNGLMGTAKIISLSASEAELHVELNQEPPLQSDIHLILALPRPKVLRRTLQTITTLGIKQVTLINSYRVEKSYWQTPLLSAKKIEEQLILGLEQAGDTKLPEIFLAKRFKPFVEDNLPALLQNSSGLVAHPKANQPCPVGCPDDKSIIVIGPEGGFIDYEIEMLIKAGCKAVSIGPRILKVETAITSVVARLSC